MVSIRSVILRVSLFVIHQPMWLRANAILFFNVKWTEVEVDNLESSRNANLF